MRDWAYLNRVVEGPSRPLQQLLAAGRDASEIAHGVRTVAFDKTGTLTVGKPTLAAFEAVGRSRGDALRLAAAIQAGSEHPLARAVLAAADREPILYPTQTSPSEVY